MTQLIHLDGNSLTLEEVIAVARRTVPNIEDERSSQRSCYRIS